MDDVDNVEVTNQMENYISEPQNVLVISSDGEDNNDDDRPKTPPTPDAMKEKVEEEIEEIFYVQPIEDPYKKAISYLEKHNVLQLFQAITSNLVCSRPEDPIQFMIDEVERLKPDNKYQTIETID